MRNTRYRQPAWYRYVAGFAGPKPVVVVENPYGGVVPEMVADLKVGKGYDRFRLSLYEAAALGANMSVPYGAWLGSVEEDAFYPPHGLCVEIQDFLAAHEPLFSRETWHEVALVYSIESEFRRPFQRDQVANDPRNRMSGSVSPFWQVAETLCHAGHPYDVLIFPDGELRPDSLTVADLHQYRTLILPDCRALTPAQAALLEALLDDEKSLVVVGDLGVNLPAEVMRPILTHAGTHRVDGGDSFTVGALPGGPQVRLHPQADLMLNVQRTATGAALHVIRYAYDQVLDRTPLLPELIVELRLP
jgi:hypothetical protein